MKLAFERLDLDISSSGDVQVQSSKRLFPQTFEKSLKRARYTDEGTRQTLLKPLAERALKLSPSDTHLWRLVFKLNSKLKTYAGRTREADLAMAGAILQNLDPASSSAASSSLLKDPGALAEKFRLCHVRDGSWKTGCDSTGKLWFPRQGSRMSGA